jgi:hypothetical protein
MVVDPPLTSWPKYYMLTLNSFFVIHNFIFQFLHYEFIRLTKALSTESFKVTQLVAHWQLGFDSLLYFFLFKHHVYHGFGGHYFNLIFSNFALFFFSFFVLSHSRTKGSQFVFQCEKFKMHQHFAIVKVYTLSE